MGERLCLFPDPLEDVGVPSEPPAVHVRCVDDRPYPRLSPID